MAEQILKTSKSGKPLVIAYEETGAERQSRLEHAAENATDRFTLTPGQAKTLARARRIADRR